MARYVDSAAKQLNGRLGFAKRVGRFGTCYIPAALGFVSVLNAPSGLKVRTLLFEEGFAIVGGAIGNCIF
jgi:hypothetical protein